MKPRRSIHRDRVGRYGTGLLWLAVLVLVVGGPVTGAAQALGDRVQINGYGTWAFGKTNNDNYFLFAGPDGEYEHLEAALSFTSTVSDSVKVYMQPNFEYGHAGFDVELGFAFVDWEIKENLHLRAGRVRHPFGIYTEIFDVGTVRPFINLPQGFYHSKNVARSYNGLGLNGSVFLSGDWAIEYDLYGGEIDLVSTITGGTSEVKDVVKDTVGARLVVETPVNGLRFGVSGYTGKQTEDESQGVTAAGGTQTVYGVLGEYLANGWSVRSEWLKLDDPSYVKHMAYLEVAYMVTEQWQLAGRWDWYDNELDLIAAGYPAVYQQLLEHEDLGFAVNYWVNPKMVFKL